MQSIDTKVFVVASLETQLLVPDLWQQRAVNLLAADHDVIIDAPTGSGKTYIFELLVEQNCFRKSVFTVPTRALANDKFREWEARGWRVGIETGDLSYQIDAPIVVATLETQKRRLMLGKGPDLLVIDEYQMLGDPARGINYELALALAPSDTRLLLLSGSVANPTDIQRWLTRSQRSVQLVQHKERPVPLDEPSLDSLPELPARTAIQGRWPRYISRALHAGLGPILVFAPRRKAAESLALQLARQLGEPDAIALTAEQKAVAGPQLTQCLKQRIAFHHSGMSYAQRAALVEPLAKASQLKVIVATTGLAAGINFAMRSVLISENEYRVAEAHRHLRPDELLQMFGRAGRRGLDQRGFALHTTGTPRLSEARPLKLQREETVDWPSLITILRLAAEANQSPLEATRELTQRLFSENPVALGLSDFLDARHSKITNSTTKPAEQALPGGTVSEFLNSEGIWERRRAATLCPLKDCLLRQGEDWGPALASAKILSSLRLGTLWKTGRGRNKSYGLRVPIAQFPGEENQEKLLLSKWLLKALREEARTDNKRPNIPRFWKLEAIEKHILPKIASYTHGGKLAELQTSADCLLACLDYKEAQIHAYRDLTGKALLNPKERRRQIPGSHFSQGDKQAAKLRPGQSVAEQWFHLGLIDRSARPTRRGIIFSYFNHGEGLAIAAALEAKEYPIEEILYDLANIRAGHRFNALALAGRPLTAFCLETYGSINISGYLRRGLPEDYGEGASEIIYNIEHRSSKVEAYLGEELSRGDIERAQLEWRSLRNHIAHAPDFEWDRWMELKAACSLSIANHRNGLPFESLPPLTPQQSKSRVWHVNI